MAGRSQEKDNREFKQGREMMGADYNLGFSKESSSREEANAPYKLEPNATEIENFLTRLRQEGL